MRDSLTHVIGVCYSGFGNGKNNPEMQAIQNIGPIPRGLYKIAALIDSESHGPYAIVLLPNPANSMFGRSGFLIHGDSEEHPGAASKGCIIAAHSIRVDIWTSDDHDLQVIES